MRHIMIKLPSFDAIRPLSAAVFILLVGALQGQSAIRYDSQPGGKIRIEGTSTLHDWTVETRAIAGFMELDSAFDADLKTLTTQPKVEITVPVRQLKSTDNKPNMDKVMYAQMGMTNNPVVKYRLLNLAPKAGAAGFDATGELTISGVTRTNTMPVSFQRVDKTKIKVNGSTDVKMTDYKISPPVLSILGIGAIKTGDDVKLSFEWMAAQAEAK